MHVFFTSFVRYEIYFEHVLNVMDVLKTSQKHFVLLRVFHIFFYISNA